MITAAERHRSLTGLAPAAVVLVLLSAGLYVAFDSVACPGGDGPAMAEASSQAIVCGEGGFNPWGLIGWVIATAGGLAAQVMAFRRAPTPRQRVLGLLLPVLVPVLLYFVLQAPAESCTDEVKLTEPPERCEVPR